MKTGPSDEQLRAFIEASLSDLDESLREPEVIDELIRDTRDLWVMLYRVSHEADTLEQEFRAPSPRD